MSDKLPLSGVLDWFARRVGRSLGAVFLFAWRLTHPPRRRRGGGGGGGGGGDDDDMARSE